MPKNKTELKDWDRRLNRRRWIRRLILWPMIIAGGFFLDWVVIYQLQLTQEASKLLIGIIVGAMTAQVLRAVE